MDAEEEIQRTRRRRAHVRYPVHVPAMFRARDGSVRATGIVETLSAGGGLLTNTEADLELGESGVLRLMALSQSLRTTSRDTLELEAEVVHKGMAGFGRALLRRRRVPGPTAGAHVRTHWVDGG